MKEFAKLFICYDLYIQEDRRTYKAICLDIPGFDIRVTSFTARSKNPEYVFHYINNKTGEFFDSEFLDTEAWLIDEYLSVSRSTDAGTKSNKKVRL